MNVFVVRWFCGEHDKNSDFDGHPSGAMNILISQLLVQIQIHIESDLETIPDVSSVVSIESAFSNKSVNDLCRIFSELVGLLSVNTVVFCIVWDRVL